MSNQAIVTLITGLLATLVGGGIAILAAYLQQKMANENAVNALICEKIEEA